jgi:hypothetical protein
MKQHPDRQPRRTIAVQRRDDDDCQTDQSFESDWIDGVTPYLLIKPTWCAREIRRQLLQVRDEGLFKFGFHSHGLSFPTSLRQQAAE